MEPVTDLRRRILFKFALPGRYASPADVPNQVRLADFFVNAYKILFNAIRAFFEFAHLSIDFFTTKFAIS